ncbi:LRR and CARD domains-containing protein 3) (Nucleotide-binding oligomerization domain protein 3) [Durusdinium trenchii]|uniref:LRR and CARD domains-containing protein 3 (Nucleotide-binding oligomerization domain protein 3 n=1 Tax=Durusdinium trenchii TaxID=1381693 RepID=A0ABP0PUP9_9DINO
MAAAWVYVNKNVEVRSAAHTAEAVTALRAGPAVVVDVEAVRSWKSGKVKCNGKGIDAKGAQAIAEALGESKVVEGLALYGNKIGDPGAAALAGVLERHDSLVELLLWNNKIGGKGGAALANALAVNKRLLKLDLTANRIGLDGGVAMGAALTRNSTLLELNLQDNMIGPKGCVAVALALQTNSTLEVLLLEGNNPEREGAEALLDAVAQSITLNELKLSDDEVPAELRREIAEIAQRINLVEPQTDDLAEEIKHAPSAVWESTRGIDLKMTRAEDWEERDVSESEMKRHTNLIQAGFLQGGSGGDGRAQGSQSGDSDLVASSTRAVGSGTTVAGKQAFAEDDDFEFVVTRPQWLVSNLTNVLCDPHHLEARLGGLIDSLPRQLWPDLKRWETRALMSRQFAEHFWVDKTDYFLALMEEMMLACRWDASSDFLLPSLLPSVDHSDVVALRASFENATLCWLDFEFLPKGVFQRFLAAFVGPNNFLISTSGRADVKAIFADLILLDFESTDALIFIGPSQRRVFVRINATNNQRVVIETIKIIFDCFRRIDEGFMRHRLDPKLVVSKDGSEAPSSCAAYEEIFRKPQGLVKAVDDRTRIERSDFFETFGQPLRGRGGGEITTRAFDVLVVYDPGLDATGRSVDDRVGDIAERLRRKKLTVWVDKEENMNVDPQLALVRGIADCCVVVAFLTHSYLDKITEDEDDTVQQSQFLYAKALRPVIPVLLEKGVGAKARKQEVVRSCLSSDAWIDMTSDDKVTSRLGQLEDEVRLWLNA